MGQITIIGISEVICIVLCHGGPHVVMGTCVFLLRQSENKMSGEFATRP